MEKHVFVVFTNEVEGQENIYNEWYTDVHLKDVLKVPGIVAAQRFKLGDVQREGTAPPWRYLALYEIETDDLARTKAALAAGHATRTPMPPSLDLGSIVSVFYKAM